MDIVTQETYVADAWSIKDKSLVFWFIVNKKWAQQSILLMLLLTWADKTPSGLSSYFNDWFVIATNVILVNILSTAKQKTNVYILPNIKYWSIK